MAQYGTQQYGTNWTAERNKIRGGATSGGGGGRGGRGGGGDGNRGGSGGDGGGGRGGRGGHNNNKRRRAPAVAAPAAAPFTPITPFTTVYNSSVGVDYPGIYGPAPAPTMDYTTLPAVTSTPTPTVTPTLQAAVNDVNRRRHHKGRHR